MPRRGALSLRGCGSRAARHVRCRRPPLPFQDASQPACLCDGNGGALRGEMPGERLLLALQPVEQGQRAGAVALARERSGHPARRSRLARLPGERRALLLVVGGPGGPELGADRVGGGAARAGVSGQSSQGDKEAPRRRGAPPLLMALHARGAKHAALLLLIAQGPGLGALALLPVIEHAAGAGMHPVEDDVEMRVRRVGVDGIDRLVLVPAHGARKEFGGFQHLRVAGPLGGRPGEAHGLDRCGARAPAPAYARRPP